MSGPDSDTIVAVHYSKLQLTPSQKRSGHYTVNLFHKFHVYLSLQFAEKIRIFSFSGPSLELELEQLTHNLALTYISKTYWSLCMYIKLLN